MSKYSFIMMSCGYVESNQTSWLLYGTHFHGREGFDTMQEAITELALDLYAKYYDECLSSYINRYSFSKCCTDSLIKDKEAKFCSKCGKPLIDKEFNADHFIEFIVNLHGSTCDSYGEAEYANGRHFVWWPWSMHEFIDASKDEIIFIGESAEYVLLAALFDAKPELIKENDYEVHMRDWEDYFKQNKQPSYR